MKEVISEFGNGILAAIVVVAMIVMCMGVFRTHLRDGIIIYDEKVYGTTYSEYV